MAIIDDPSVYWQMKQWTGNDGTSALTFDGNADLQADLFWLKTRNAGDLWRCYDSVRGVNIGLVPNAADAEQNVANDGITAIGSDGFTMVDGSAFGGGNYNQSSTNYIAYAWKAGTAFTNDASSTGIGTIDSTGSSNQTAGFSIVSYTSNGSASQSVAHNLGGVPEMIISKNRDSTSASYNYWTVYHHSLATANDKKLKLNTTDAVSTTNEWGDTNPTSTVYSLHTSGDGTTNVSTDKIISYCFRSIKGYSKIGSYTGNGAADGPFVYTGFKPNFVLLKWSAGAENWSVYDTSRNPINGPNDSFFAVDSVSAENSNSSDLDMLSNGFKLIRAHNRANASDAPYIYMAFAENPFVTSTGVPTTAR
jgi:hypothetical protein